MSEPTYNGRTRAQLVAIIGENAADNYISFHEPDERRAIKREICGKGDCDLGADHVGPHRGSCGCLDGCVVLGCPNFKG